MKEAIKQGYKLTELGLIPEDWGITEFQSEGLFYKGKGIRKDEVISQGKPCIRYGQLYTIYDEIIKNAESFISEDVAKQSFKLNYGDLLFAGSGETRDEIGKSAVILKDNTYAGGDIVVFRTKNIDPVFLGYLSNSNPIVKQKVINGQGDTVVHIYSSGISSIKIPLPSLPEQKAIAKVLSDTDILIKAVVQKLVKKRAIKQGAMQRLLKPKEDWERVRLDSVIEVSRGGSPRPIKDYITSSPTGVNWIKIGDTSRTSKYIISSKEKIIPEGVQNSRNVYVGDFLLSNSMSFGRPYILKIEGCIHDGWLVLQNYQNSFDREFLYYTLMSEDIHNQYLMKASGSGVLNLNKELVKTVELNKPKSLKEQTQIATILSDMDVELKQLELKLAKYKLVKQGLMQELLTGKIRLV